MGQRVETKIYLLNNTEKTIECIFKTFHKMIESNEVKVDPTIGNFIIKSLTPEYAKEMLQCCSSILVEKTEVAPFEEMVNTLVVTRAVSPADRKLFQAYASDPNYDQINEQAINETLLIRTTFSSGICRVPIKFILAFPRVKINTNVLEYGIVRERTDTPQ